MLNKYLFELGFSNIEPKEVVTIHAPIEEVCRILTPQIYFSLVDWGMTANGDVATQVKLMDIMTCEKDVVSNNFPITNEPISSSQAPAYISEIRQTAAQDSDPYFAISPFTYHDMTPNPECKFSLFMNEPAKKLTFRTHDKIDSIETPSYEWALTDLLDSIRPDRGETRSLLNRQFSREFGYSILLGTANVYGVHQEILPYILSSQTQEHEDMIFDTVVFLTSMGYLDISRYFLLYQFENKDIPQINKAIAAQYLKFLDLQSLTSRTVFDQALTKVRTEANHGLINNMDEFYASMLLEIGVANRRMQ